jgi:predicted phosphodiesterase
MYIIHLSDIHFDGSSQANKWFVQLSHDLRSDLKIDVIDALIISGDIANRSTSYEYKEAKIFLDLLRDEFSLTPEKIIIVPGNHDVDQGITDWRRTELDLDNLAYTTKLRSRCTSEELQVDSYIEESSTRVWVCNNEKYKERFRKFSDFYESISGKPYSLNYDEQYSINHLSGLNIIVLGLNSAWQLDHHYTNRANINIDALTNALEKIRNNPSFNECVKIAIWHHPVNSSGDDRIKDTGFRELLAVAGFEIFLHGHIHEPENSFYHYDMNAEGRRLVGVCAGTFGAPIRQLVSGFPWQYNILKFEGNVLTVKTRCREKLNGAWKSDARWSQGPGKSSLDYYTIELTEKKKGQGKIIKSF